MNRSFEVQGKNYSSIKSFLAEHGFSRDQFNKTLSYDDGSNRYILAAERLLSSNREKKIKPRAIPVIINGMSYRSISQACRLLELSESRVSRLCKKGIAPSESISMVLASNERIDKQSDDYISKPLNDFLYKRKPLMERLDEWQCVLQADD
ncbi:hypothetical protein L3V83_13285 [Thiotrichales bacterium 19X7-9]|nr:hypothetical protein [Thiotrichales bacterium 19X7-9]